LGDAGLIEIKVERRAVFDGIKSRHPRKAFCRGRMIFVNDVSGVGTCGNQANGCDCHPLVGANLKLNRAGNRRAEQGVGTHEGDGMGSGPKVLKFGVVGEL